MGFPKRETARLRFGRASVPHASYFLTICTKNRIPVLTRPDIGRSLLEIIHSMHSSGDMDLVASTLMPDHVHLLLTLGHRLSIGQIMGKLKSLSRDRGNISWRWQDDGFEHRLRNIESVDDYGFYIFMNPYRAGLCSLAHGWPWWICPNPGQMSFLTKLESDQSVPSAWLGMREEIAARLVVHRWLGPPASSGPTETDARRLPAV